MLAKKELTTINIPQIVNKKNHQKREPLKRMARILVLF